MNRKIIEDWIPRNRIIDGERVDWHETTTRQRIEQVDRKSRVQSSVTLAKKLSAAPPAPTKLSLKVLNPNSVKLAFNVVDDPKVAAYNVYRALKESQVFVAERISVLPQSPDSTRGWIEFADETNGASSKIYWVASANSFGIESPRVQFTPTTTGLIAYKTVDEDLASSTTLQDDDKLFVSLNANSRYDFEITVFTNNVGTTEGIKLAVNGTVTLTSMKAQISIWDDTTNTLAAFARVTAFDSAVGVALSAGTNYATIKGTIETGATSGTFKLRWAQQVSGASNTTVQRGSVLICREI